MRWVILETSDGCIFSLKAPLINMHTNIIRTLTTDSVTKTIKLEKVSANALLVFLKWCHIKVSGGDLVQKFNEMFNAISIASIFDAIAGAEYMACHELVHECTQHLLHRMNCKTLQQIKRDFDLKLK